ncbi:nicotinate-nucleotide--dimethylbenzimidazole phosphoribosyltransferase [Megasphaera vaginalis (ex Bordigoni et al. 2020)]|uniref:nicotinate-nucleotide--dimethylbenzimidazole phosphoribosyltransferase n=1 Tax=Megasphaera vaginalis (ex Bordigoni et al. 2020) TaxID=2045301 RepID=UPI000C7C145A|nr:nicotinate-nucleotide--dimethylbenzimidazole phosphoribosyltransferase [Megasphaera vaginalis (ex Bordigoni et al. 2020)]
MDSELAYLIGAIEPADAAAAAVCKKKMRSVDGDKRLAALATQLAGIRRTAAPAPLRKGVVIFAADHAVDGGENETKGRNSKADALEIASGRGAVNKIAHRIGAGVLLLDVGLEADLPESPGFQVLKVMHGSRFFGRQAAMTEDEMLDALFSGVQVAENLADEGYTAIALGNLGERALLSAFMVTAPFLSANLDLLRADTHAARQMKNLQGLWEKAGVDGRQPLRILQYFGAPDIAALTGVVLAAAKRRLAVVFDNAVTGAAVLTAGALCPHALDYVLPSAAYVEPVHRMQMRKLGMQPFLQTAAHADCAMGSVLGLSLLDAAVQLLTE